MCGVWCVGVCVLYSISLGKGKPKKKEQKNGSLGKFPSSKFFIVRFGLVLFILEFFFCFCWHLLEEFPLKKEDYF